jgi:hypothetical protein
MNLEKAILTEHSKSHCDKIVRYVGKDKKRFAELMRLFFDGEYRVNQRASWPLSNIVRKNPDIVRPYMSRIISNMDKKGIHSAVLRNTVRLLQDIEIPGRLRGRLMNKCFELISSEDIPVAVKVFSMTILYNLSIEYPEIIPELRLLLEDRWEKETVAFRSRAGKIMARLPNKPAWP